MGSRSQDSQTQDADIRVLVVDGRAKRAAAVRKALQAAPAPFVVSPARRLWSAVQILAGIDIDAVVLGSDLPDTEGRSALDELCEQSPDVPVLVIVDDPERSLDEGADAYLQSDQLDPSSLGLHLIDAIERRRSALPGRADPTPAEAVMPLASVLLVEDDSWVQRLLRRSLERHGHRVHVVGTPQKALAWSQQSDQHIDVLICDGNPPGMEGERLSHHLQRQFPELRTLLVGSVYSTGERTAEYAVLPRPYSLEDFARAVNDLVNTGQPTKV